MVNDEVVGQHADEAAFLWTMRERATSQPHYSLKDLAALDERLEAHLDGLGVAGRKGWECCRANMEHLGPGEAFALAVLAFRSGQRDHMRDALFAGCASPSAQRGLVSALGWLEPEQAAPWMELLLKAAAPEHRMVGIAAHAIHRRDPGPAIDAAIEDAHPALRSRALRAVGELKRIGSVHALRDHLDDEALDCRFWSAWSLCLLGRPDGLPELVSAVEAQSPHLLRALGLALRVMPLPDSRRWVQALATRAGLERLTVLATGIVGDPISVPWLVRTMQTPNLARLAGEAFTLVTGVDLRLSDMVVDTTEAGADAKADDAWAAYEASLPTPSVSLVAAWWEQNRRRFPTGTRHLCGRQVRRETAMAMLVHGNQRQRQAAALELACLEPRAVLFEIRAPGGRQLRQMHAWAL